MQNENNLVQIQQNVNEKVDEQVREQLEFSSKTWFWVLVVINVGAMIAAWEYYA